MLLFIFKGFIELFYELCFNFIVVIRGWVKVVCVYFILVEDRFIFFLILRKREGKKGENKKLICLGFKKIISYVKILE